MICKKRTGGVCKGVDWPANNGQSWHGKVGGRSGWEGAHHEPRRAAHAQHSATLPSSSESPRGSPIFQSPFPSCSNKPCLCKSFDPQMALAQHRFFCSDFSSVCLTRFFFSFNDFSYEPKFLSDDYLNFQQVTCFSQLAL